MKLEQVNLRDPFLLPYQGVYYLYGTRSASCWGEMNGFDCYRSTDLEEWEGPIEIFHRPEGFPMDRSYWAPECYFLGGRFYLLVTFAGPEHKKGLTCWPRTSPPAPLLSIPAASPPKTGPASTGPCSRRRGKTTCSFPTPLRTASTTAICAFSSCRMT